jgi:hypothetical protein
MAVPVISNMIPSVGSVNGGITVIIFGINLTGATAVKFDGVDATSFVVDNDEQIHAVSPAHAAASIYVNVTTPGGTNSDGTTNSFVYTASPIVYGLTPSSGLPGSTAGGTVVTISGANFIGATAVKFDGVDAESFIVDSDIQVRATAPAHVPGSFYVSVITPSGTSQTNPSSLFEYVEPVPVVTDVVPLTGSMSGGDGIVLTGTGFTYATGVRFGSIETNNFTIISDIEINVISPVSNIAGTIDVTVITGNWVSETGLADQFTYTVPLPVIDSLSTSEGSIIGGTPVTITGTNMAMTTNVHFGLVPAVFTAISDTQIQAITPPGAAGIVDITITSPSGTSLAVSTDEFTYIVYQPVINSLSPSSGWTNGGTVVTLLGANFTDASAVMFGSVAAVSFNVLSDSKIMCVSPEVINGVVDVAVVTSGGTSIVNSNSTFTFLSIPNLGFYADETLMQPIAAMQAFMQVDALDQAVFTYFYLTNLLASQVQNVYRRSGTITRILNSSGDTPDYILDLLSNTITLTVGLGISDILFVMPTGSLTVTVIGPAGTVQQSTVPVWLSRSDSATYGNLVIRLCKAGAVDINITAPNILAAIVGGYSKLTGFVNLPGNVVGCGVIYNGVCIGRCVAATATSITIDSGSFASDIPSTVQLLSCAIGDVALEIDGIAGPYMPILLIPELDYNNDPLKILVRESYVIPAQSSASPDTYLRVTSVVS